jgi:choline dehydrogenase
MAKREQLQIERRMSDYIIVGAGAAGCVLANRLTADTGATVTVLEAGGWDKSPFIHMPAGYFRLMQTGQLDWGYHSVPQKNMDGRVLFLPRAKSIGGSTTVNGMVYTRGDRTDYDHWRDLGNVGWSYEDCLPYFKKSETWVDGETAIHGGSGPLKTSRFGIKNPLALAFIQAGQQAGYQYNDDLNGGSQEGFGPCDSTLADGVRSSASRCYLTPVRNRRNLHVVTDAVVSRILLEGDRAVGVEFLQGKQVRRIYASQEVILAGGTFNSPHLLQISGIGDPTHLMTIGVAPNHKLPGVGKNLQDHVGCGVKQRITQPLSALKHLNLLNSASALAKYAATKTGPAAYHGIEAIAFVKTRPDIVAPDIQLHLNMLMYEDHGRRIFHEEGVTPHVNISRPRSRGTVLARSPDPLSLAAIDPNFYAEADDLRVMRDGLRVVRELMSQPAFDSFRGEEFAPGVNVQSDEDLDAYLRGKSESVYHPVGTCKMGHDDDAVVDSRLRVRGLSGLRIVDASIMPTITSCNTNAPTIMIAEKAADMIIADASVSLGSSKMQTVRQEALLKD